MVDTVDMANHSREEDDENDKGLQMPLPSWRVESEGMFDELLWREKEKEEWGQSDGGASASSELDPLSTLSEVSRTPIPNPKLGHELHLSWLSNSKKDRDKSFCFACFFLLCLCWHYCNHF